MNVYIIAFLLGMSPAPENQNEIKLQWQALNQEERQALVYHFEEEYGVNPKKLKESDIKDLNQIQYRTWDRME